MSADFMELHARSYATLIIIYPTTGLVAIVVQAINSNIVIKNVCKLASDQWEWEEQEEVMH